MRTFKIDYTSSNNLPDGDIVGKYGEHNATLLSITPPSDMAENTEIAFYRIAFGLTNCRTVHSEKIEKAETVSYLLNAQITRSDIISVQLVGYDAENKLVMKSETVKKLKFAESVGGVEVDPDGKSYNIGAEVNALQKKIENFSEDANGNLLYKGKPIMGGRPTREITLVGKNSDYYCGSYDTSYSIIDATYSFANGTEIKSIEILYEGKWINIYDIARYDGYPTVVNMYSVSEETIGFSGESVLAIISPLFSVGVLTALLINSETDIKVTVYEEAE